MGRRAGQKQLPVHRPASTAAAVAVADLERQPLESSFAYEARLREMDPTRSRAKTHATPALDRLDAQGSRPHPGSDSDHSGQSSPDSHGGPRASPEQQKKMADWLAAKYGDDVPPQAGEVLTVKQVGNLKNITDKTRERVRILNEKKRARKEQAFALSSTVGAVAACYETIIGFVAPTFLATTLGTVTAASAGVIGGVAPIVLGYLALKEARASRQAGVKPTEENQEKMLTDITSFMTTGSASADAVGAERKKRFSAALAEIKGDLGTAIVPDGENDDAGDRALQKTAADLGKELKAAAFITGDFSQLQSALLGLEEVQRQLVADTSETIEILIGTLQNLSQLEERVGELESEVATNKELHAENKELRERVRQQKVLQSLVLEQGAQDEPGQDSGATSLPHPWIAHTDPDTGNQFYENTETNVTSWVRPVA